MAVVVNQRVRWAAGLCLAFAACAPDDEPLEVGDPALGDAAQPVVIAPDAATASDASIADALVMAPQDTGVPPTANDASLGADGGPAQPEAGLDASTDASSDAGSSDGSVASDAGGDARVISDAGNDAGGAGCSALTYQSFGQQFFTTYCTGCHSGAGASRGIRLDTLANVKTNAAAIRRQAVAGTSMPPRTPRPSAMDRQKLGQFLDCGPI